MKQTLTIESMKDGEVAKQFNSALVAAFEDLLKRPDLIKPKRKVVLSREFTEDEGTGELILKPKIDIKLPGLYPTLEFKIRGRFRSERGQLYLDLDEDNTRSKLKVVEP